MTPEGIKRESDVDRAESITPKTGKKLDRMIIAGLVLIIAGMGVERAWFAGREEAAPEPTANQSESVVLDKAKTIAVLPFADMSESQDQAWFSDGLAEEILNALARAPDLLVSSRTSSFAYKETNTPIAQIASELGVAHVLEGSVRRAGDRIRVTAQLIRAADGFHLWSENYDRNADDIIAVQEELAINIAKALKTTMDPKALEQMLSAGTRSVEAYERYLNGLTLTANAWDEPGWSSLLRGYEEFEAARKTDADFSSAHAMAALFWHTQISISRRGTGLVSESPAEKMNRFRERIDQAISTAGNPVDRQRHEALLASLEMRVRDAIRLSKIVLEARPYDVETYDILFNSAQAANDLATLEVWFKRAFPLWENGSEWLRLIINTAWSMEILGAEVDVDLVEWIPAATMKSRKASPAYQAHRALLWLGETEKANSMLPYLVGETDDSRAIIDFRQACAEGRRSDAERILNNLPDHWTPEVRASTIWHLYQMLGRYDEATRALKPFVSLESPLTVGAYLYYPDFDPTPYPVVMSIIQREGIKRGPPAKIPFACPEQDLIQQESVAVLPFTSMSSGEDDGYFADGLTEEILNSLASLPELLVTARTSSFHFKGQNIPIPEIAAKLGVEHVVEGSVRRAGDKVRITAQLIRAGDGFHLWSQTYDRTLEDVFAVQEDIAANIAATLDVVLNEDKRKKMRDAGIKDVDAFIAYQKGWDAFGKAHSTDDPVRDLPEANRYFDEALAIVPGITNAHFLRTDLYGHIIYNNAIGLIPASPEVLESSLAEILSSLAQAARYAPTEGQRLFIEAERAEFSSDWSGIPEKFDRAFQFTDCIPVNWVGSLAGIFGWADQLSTLFQRNLRCDPLSGLWATFVGQNELWAGRPQAALEASERHLREVGFNPWVDDARFSALLATGKYRDDPSVLEPNPEGSNFSFPRRLLVYAMNNDLETARKIFADYAQENPPNNISSVIVAAVLGDRETANAYASNMDAVFAGPFILAEVVNGCRCGAPFDLDATPNFKARIEGAGFAWPPPTPIKFPAKDW
jgi:TolB-like protein